MNLKIIFMVIIYIPCLNSCDNFFYHTNYLILGSALNPWDKTRTCGGSTGGCAGLVAANCSPMGIGNDGVYI